MFTCISLEVNSWFFFFLWFPKFFLQLRNIFGYTVPKIRRKHSTWNPVTIKRRQSKSTGHNSPEKRSVCICINIHWSITAFLWYMKTVCQIALTLTPSCKHILLALQWHSHHHLPVLMLTDFCLHTELRSVINLQQIFPIHFLIISLHLCKSFNITVYHCSQTFFV